uniref:Serine/threonine-protein kinase receptor n=1 Tax=Syphacia muris TaxID=451379 RepID=A0A0N5A8A8_9BILA
MLKEKNLINSQRNSGDAGSEVILATKTVDSEVGSGNNKKQLWCYDYDHSKCSQTQENCTKKVACNPTNLDHETYCFSVIPVVQGVIDNEKSIKGCFSQPASGTKYCKQEKCLATSRGKNALYCCCTANYCNGEMANAENATFQAEAIPMFEEKIIPSYIQYSHAIAFAIAGVLLASLMVLTCWWYFMLRIRAKRKAGVGVNSAGSTDDAEQLLHVGNSQESLNVICLTRQAKLEIGSGRFGKVYCGIFCGSYVAVKVFPKEEVNSWRTEKDIYCLSGLQNHENILRYIGSEVHEDCFWIVAEYHEKGCLYDYLKACFAISLFTKNNLTLQDALKIIISMLTGLSFLHEERVMNDGSRKPCIVHRDFKSHNVLLKNSSTAVIADFGLAMICENGKSPEGTRGQVIFYLFLVEKLVGTKRYMSPEVLEGATEFSAFAFRQIDVYAASLVLWEIIRRTVFHSEDVADEYRQPYEDEMGADPSIAMLRMGVAHKKIRPSIRNGIFRSKIGCGLWKTVEEMWNTEPDGRITAGCALERIKRLNALITVENQAFDTSSREEADLSCMYNIRRKDSLSRKDVISDSVYNELYAPPNQRLEYMPNAHRERLYSPIPSDYDHGDNVHSTRAT